MLSLIGAVVLTFWCSRGLLRLLPASMPDLIRLAVAHAVSLVVLMAVIGLANAYGRDFALDRAMIVVAPQLLWLLIDVVQQRLRHA